MRIDGTPTGTNGRWMMPTWTTQTPTEDGYYWWRMNASCKAEIRLTRNGVVKFRWGVLESYDAAENVGGEWYGPLEVPS